MGEVYDVIVVGAGIEGSSTAYHLAKAGKRTLLLEQVSICAVYMYRYICMRMLLRVDLTPGVD